MANGLCIVGILDCKSFFVLAFRSSHGRNQCIGVRDATTLVGRHHESILDLRKESLKKQVFSGSFEVPNLSESRFSYEIIAMKDVDSSSSLAFQESFVFSAPSAADGELRMLNVSWANSGVS